MEKQEPLVSVLSFPFNKNDYAIASFNNLKNQQYSNIEHIIIDDCSKDNTVELIENWIELNNHTCTFIKHKTNKGLCSSFNEAIKMSKGKYICFLSDDLWDEKRLINAVSIMESMPDNVKIYFSNAQKFNEKEMLEKISPFNILRNNNDININDYEIPINEYRIIKGETILNSLFKINPIFAPTLLINKSIYNEIGLYDENLFFEDYDFLFRATVKSDFCYHNSYNLFYRISNSGISLNSRILIEESIIKLLIKHKDKIKNSNQKSSLRRNLSNTASSLISLYLAEKDKEKALKITRDYLLPNFSLSIYTFKKLAKSFYYYFQ